MESERNFDLQKYAPSKASRWYLLRIVFYVVFLVLLGYMLISKLNQTSTGPVEVKEIEGVEIELN